MYPQLIIHTKYLSRVSIAHVYFLLIEEKKCGLLSWSYIMIGFYLLIRSFLCQLWHKTYKAYL